MFFFFEKLAAKYWSFGLKMKQFTEKDRLLFFETFLAKIDQNLPKLRS
jgi:hypothetical protein